MSDKLKTEDKLGTILVQVQDDLRKLKCSLEKITINERGKTLDVQILEANIHKSEISIRKHVEDYLKTVNKQLLVLPSIEDIQKKTTQIPKWEPAPVSIPDVRPQREDLPGASPGEKTKRQRVITGPVASLQGIESKGHHRLALPKEETGTGLIGYRFGCFKQLKWETEPGSSCKRTGRECTPVWTTETPPTTTTSKATDNRDMMQNSNVVPESPQNLPVSISSKYPFTIIKGRIDPMAADFCHFKQSFSLCWSCVVDALDALEKLLRDFAVPLAKVSGEQLLKFGHGWDSGWRKAPPLIDLLSVLENQEEVSGLVLCPGQRYKGEGGIEAAAIHIQSCWRRYLARTAYLCHCRRKWAVRTITLSWSIHTMKRRIRKSLQARRLKQLENYCNRAKHLAANWKHIQSSKRTIIHIPSLGYTRSQRVSLRGFDVLQNIQISRLCDVRDENVEVIYVCPRRLGEDMLQYYRSLLKCAGATDRADTCETSSCTGRFVILTPEAVDYFPTHNMCLSTLLKYSPRTLKHIRNLIQGKQSYVVGGVAHVDDLAVADELQVPVLAPEPAVAWLYSTKSGGRSIFVGAEVDVPPGRGDIYSLNQFHETLAELLTQNMDVQRWLFKMDSEHGGRGTAFCDVCHLSCYKWALKEYRCHGPKLWNITWIQINTSNQISFGYAKESLKGFNMKEEGVHEHYRSFREEHDIVCSSEYCEARSLQHNVSACGEARGIF